MVYGDDVFQLTKQLLQMTDDRFSGLARRSGGLGYWLRHLLGLRRSTDARRAIARVMREAIDRKHSFSLTGRTCVFQTKTATCQGAGFFVWRVEHGTFRTVQSESCVSSGSAPNSDGHCGWRQTLKTPVARNSEAPAAALKLPTCSKARHSSQAGSRVNKSGRPSPALVSVDSCAGANQNSSAADFPNAGHESGDHSRPWSDRCEEPACSLSHSRPEPTNSRLSGLLETRKRGGIPSHLTLQAVHSRTPVFIEILDSGSLPVGPVGRWRERGGWGECLSESFLEKLGHLTAGAA